MSEYPKTLKHPASKKAEPQPVKGVDPVTKRAFVDYHSVPDRFPPVVVNNEDQEADYRSKGYLEPGEPVPEIGAYQEFPKWLTHEKHEAILVNDEEQQSDAMAKGYHEIVIPDPHAAMNDRAAPYNPNLKIQEWPKMVDGVLMNDPATLPQGPIQYPKALFIPGTKEQVFVKDEKEEAMWERRWALEKSPLPVAAKSDPETPAPLSPTPAAVTGKPNSERSEKMKAAWAKRKAAKATEQAPA